jgi:hypothetical protein
MVINSCAKCFYKAIDQNGYERRHKSPRARDGATTRASDGAKIEKTTRQNLAT